MRDDFLKIAYEAGCQACLADLGLAKTAAPKWLKMLRSNPNLAEEFVAKSRWGGRDGVPYGLHGAYGKQVSGNIRELQGLDGQLVGNIRGKLRDLRSGRIGNNVDDALWSSRGEIASRLNITP